MLKLEIPGKILKCLRSEKYSGLLILVIDFTKEVFQTVGYLEEIKTELTIFSKCLLKTG